MAAQPGKRDGDRPGAGAGGSARVGSRDERPAASTTSTTYLPEIATDAELHAAVVRAAHNRRLDALYDGLQDARPRRPRRLSAPVPGRAAPARRAPADRRGHRRPRRRGRPRGDGRPPPAGARRHPSPRRAAGRRADRRVDDVVVITSTRPADVRVSPGLVASAAGHRGDRRARAGRVRPSERRRPGAGRSVPVAATGSAGRAAGRSGQPAGRHCRARDARARATTSISPLGPVIAARLAGRRVRRPGAAGARW